MAILNLGCGKSFPPDNFKEVVNVDINRTIITHIIADGNKTLPFKAKVFRAAYLMDIIEHLDNVIKVIDEVYRVLIDQGFLMIRTVNWCAEQSYNDPTHRHWFSLKSFDFFDPMTDIGSKYDHYTPYKWEILSKGPCVVSESELLFTMRKR